MGKKDFKLKTNSVSEFSLVNSANANSANPNSANILTSKINSLFCFGILLILLLSFCGSAFAVDVPSTNPSTQPSTNFCDEPYANLTDGSSAFPDYIKSSLSAAETTLSELKSFLCSFSETKSMPIPQKIEKITIPAQPAVPATSTSPAAPATTQSTLQVSSDILNDFGMSTVNARTANGTRGILIPTKLLKGANFDSFKNQYFASGSIRFDRDLYAQEMWVDAYGNIASSVEDQKYFSSAFSSAKDFELFLRAQPETQKAFDNLDLTDGGAGLASDWLGESNGLIVSAANNGDYVITAELFDSLYNPQSDITAFRTKRTSTELWALWKDSGYASIEEFLTDYKIEFYKAVNDFSNNNSVGGIKKCKTQGIPNCSGYYYADEEAVFTEYIEIQKPLANGFPSQKELLLRIPKIKAWVERTKTSGPNAITTSPVKCVGVADLKYAGPTLSHTDNSSRGLANNCEFKLFDNLKIKMSFVAGDSRIAGFNDSDKMLLLAYHTYFVNTIRNGMFASVGAFASAKKLITGAKQFWNEKQPDLTQTGNLAYVSGFQTEKTQMSKAMADFEYQINNKFSTILEVINSGESNSNFREKVFDTELKNYATNLDAQTGNNPKLVFENVLNSTKDGIQIINSASAQWNEIYNSMANKPFEFSTLKEENYAGYAELINSEVANLTPAQITKRNAFLANAPAMRSTLLLQDLQTKKLLLYKNMIMLEIGKIPWLVGPSFNNKAYFTKISAEGPTCNTFTGFGTHAPVFCERPDFLVTFSLIEQVADNAAFAAQNFQKLRDGIKTYNQVDVTLVNENNIFHLGAAYTSILEAMNVDAPEPFFDLTNIPKSNANYGKMLVANYNMRTAKDVFYRVGNKLKDEAQRAKDSLYWSSMAMLTVMSFGAGEAAMALPVLRNVASVVGRLSFSAIGASEWMGIGAFVGFGSLSAVSVKEAYDICNEYYAGTLLPDSTGKISFGGAGKDAVLQQPSNMSKLLAANASLDYSKCTSQLMWAALDVGFMFDLPFAVLKGVISPVANAGIQKYAAVQSRLSMARAGKTVDFIVNKVNKGELAYDKGLMAFAINDYVGKAGFEVAQTADGTMVVLKRKLSSGSFSELEQLVEEQLLLKKDLLNFTQNEAEFKAKFGNDVKLVVQFIPGESGAYLILKNETKTFASVKIDNIASSIVGNWKGKLIEGLSESSLLKVYSLPMDFASLVEKGKLGTLTAAENSQIVDGFLRLNGIDYTIENGAFVITKNAQNASSNLTMISVLTDRPLVISVPGAQALPGNALVLSVDDVINFQESFVANGKINWRIGGTPKAIRELIVAEIQQAPAVFPFFENRLMVPLRNSALAGQESVQRLKLLGATLNDPSGKGFTVENLRKWLFEFENIKLNAAAYNAFALELANKLRVANETLNELDTFLRIDSSNTSSLLRRFVDSPQNGFFYAKTGTGNSTVVTIYKCDGTNFEKVLVVDKDKFRFVGAADGISGNIKPSSNMSAILSDEARLKNRDLLYVLKENFVVTHFNDPLYAPGGKIVHADTAFMDFLNINSDLTATSVSSYVAVLDNLNFSPSVFEKLFSSTEDAYKLKYNFQNFSLFLESDAYSHVLNNLEFEFRNIVNNKVVLSTDDFVIATANTISLNAGSSLSKVPKSRAFQRVITSTLANRGQGEAVVSGIYHFLNWNELEDFFSKINWDKLDPTLALQFKSGITILVGGQENFGKYVVKVLSEDSLAGWVKAMQKNIRVEQISRSSEFGPDKLLNSILGNRETLFLDALNTNPVIRKNSLRVAPINKFVSDGSGIIQNRYMVVMEVIEGSNIHNFLQKTNELLNNKLGVGLRNIDAYQTVALRKAGEELGKFNYYVGAHGHPHNGNFMVATESITENPEDLIVILIDSDLVHLTPQTKDGVLYLTNGITGGWYGINNAKMKVLVDARDAAYAAAAQAP